MKQQNNLLVSFNRPSNVRLRLFCFPYAGIGASVFSDWSNYLPNDIELVAIQLPGKESRINEAPFLSLPEMINKITDEISSYMNLPFVFFGYSMGALVSFEVARMLRYKKMSQPIHLFVASFRSPQLKDRNPSIHNLPDVEFKQELKRLGGTPEEVFYHPELVDLLTPIIRQDIALCENYVYEKQKPLKCSITAFGGSRDKKLNENDMESWKMQTTGSFEIKMFSGNHFFLKDEKIALIDTISNKLNDFKKNIS